MLTILKFSFNFAVKPIKLFVVKTILIKKKKYEQYK